MIDTSGPTSPKQFASYDHESRSWKTYPDTGLWGPIEYSQTWPKHGMTRNGAAFALPTLGHLTGGSGSSSLLPTPRATDGTKGGPNQRGSSGDLMLPSAVTDL